MSTASQLREFSYNKKAAAQILCLQMFARMCVLWEVTLLRLLKQELQNLKLSMVGLISASDQPKPFDTGTKKASLKDPHTHSWWMSVCARFS